MTAPPPTPEPEQINELVSAYLDGAAAPDEIQLVESSDELMARVESMRAVTSRLGDSFSPPSDAMRENHLAAALGEFDRLFADNASTAQDATVTALPTAASEPASAASEPAAVPQQRPVTSLSEARERKRPRRLNMVAAAAAAVAILFAGFVAVGINRGGETNEVVDAASDAVEASSDLSSASSAIESTESDVLPAPTALADRAAAADDDAMEAMEDAMDDSAMAEEAAMEEEEADFALADEAAMDDAMDGAMDDEEAMADDAEAQFAPAPQAEDAADATGPAGAVAEPVGFLGSYDTVDDLRAAVIEDLDGAPVAIQADARSVFLAGVDQCSDIAPELREAIGPTLIASALLDDEAVELHAGAENQVLVLGVPGCELVEALAIG